MFTVVPNSKYTVFQKNIFQSFVMTYVHDALDYSLVGFDLLVNVHSLLFVPIKGSPKSLVLFLTCSTKETHFTYFSFWACV